MTKRTVKFFNALIALGMLVLPVTGQTETCILEGNHRVILDIINPTGVKFIPDYQNAGFSQRVVETKRYAARVEIIVTLDTFSSREPFPVSPRRLPEEVQAFMKPEAMVQSEHAEIQRQARKLVAGATTEVMAFERVAFWMADNVRYEIHTRQDALSVLRNRAGSCAGQTRLMMALLRAEGIPARYARGFLPPGGMWGFEKEYWGVTIMSGGYHAWVEVYFPDQGWVFSDILHSLYFVDPYHLLFQIAGTELNPGYETFAIRKDDGNIEIEKGTSFTIFEQSDQSRIVDLLPDPKRLLLARRNKAQTSCTIFGQAFDPSGKPIKSGDFIFWQGDKGKVYPIDKNGRFSASGFSPGTYSVSVRAEGYREARKSVAFHEVEIKELNFQLEPGGSVFGKVTDLSGRPVSGAWVYLWQGNKGRGYPADEKGRYNITGCPVGIFRLSVQIEGQKKTETEVEIESGARVEHNFVLGP